MPAASSDAIPAGETVTGPAETVGVLTASALAMPVAVMDCGPFASDTDAVPNASADPIAAGVSVTVPGVTVGVPAASAEPMPVGDTVTVPGVTMAVPNAPADAIPVGLTVAVPGVTAGTPNVSADAMPPGASCGSGPRSSNSRCGTYSSVNSITTTPRHVAAALESTVTAQPSSTPARTVGSVLSSSAFDPWTSIRSK